MIGISMPVVKHSFQVLDPREIPHLIHEAFHVARTGRPGPGAGRHPAGPLARRHPLRPGRGGQGRPAPATRTSRRATPSRSGSRPRRSPTPSARCSTPAAASSTATPRTSWSSWPTTGKFPVTCTVMGLGAFPAPHEQWLGMLGMHGTRTANYAMDEADLIVAIGARFDDRITGKLSEFAPNAKFVHIDVDPAEISKNVPGAHPDRRQLQADPAEADGRVPRARHRRVAARRLVEEDPRLAGGVPADVRGVDRRRHRAAAHDPGDLRGHQAATRSSPRTSASTRCGRRSTTTSPSRAAGSTPAGSARWASACLPRSAPRSRCRTSWSCVSRATAA